MKLRVRVTVDPSEEDGMIDDSFQADFGTSRGYNNEDSNDVEACEHCAPSYGDWCLKDGATPECELSDQNGENGNLLEATVTRVNQNEIKVLINATGANACASVAAAIDFNGTLFIRQTCADGELGPLEVKGSFQYDGFPWHEVYIDGIQLFVHDPCITEEGPFSLFPPAEHTFSIEEWREIPSP
jgi:hypothetical protein